MEIGQLTIILAAWPAFRLIQRSSDNAWRIGQVGIATACIAVAAVWTGQRVLLVVEVGRLAIVLGLIVGEIAAMAIDLLAPQVRNRDARPATDIQHDITWPDFEASGHPSGQEEGTWRHLVATTIDLVPGIRLQLRITIQVYAAQGRPELACRYPLLLFDQRVDTQ